MAKGSGSRKKVVETTFHLLGAHHSNANASNVYRRLGEICDKYNIKNPLIFLEATPKQVVSPESLGPTEEAYGQFIVNFVKERKGSIVPLVDESAWAFRHSSFLMGNSPIYDLAHEIEEDKFHVKGFMKMSRGNKHVIVVSGNFHVDDYARELKRFKKKVKRYQEGFPELFYSGDRYIKESILKGTYLAPVTVPLASFYKAAAEAMGFDPLSKYGNIMISSDRVVFEKYKRVLSKLVASGKYELDKSIFVHERNGKLIRDQARSTISKAYSHVHKAPRPFMTFSHDEL